MSVDACKAMVVKMGWLHDILGFCVNGCWVLCSGGGVVNAVVARCGVVVVVYAERREKK